MNLRCNNYSIVLALGLVLTVAAVLRVNAQEKSDTATHQSESPATIPGTIFTAQEIALIRALGPWPIDVQADPGNEFSHLEWATRLGEKLFNDTALSGDQNIACVTCHQPSNGFDDGIAKAIGKASHKRNTQTLWNVGLQRWFGWDGGTDSLWAASLRPILSNIEMDADIPVLASRLRNRPYFVNGLRADQSGLDIQTLSDEQLVVLAGKLLGAYVRTIVSGETEFDRFRKALLDNSVHAQNRYPESAKRGLRIFIGEANCHVCHFGPNFSNGEFHDTGRPFFTGVGEVDPGRYNGIKRVREDRYNLAGQFNGDINPDEVRKTTSVKLGQVNFGQWRTPSLRNLTATGPYMHDGSVPTLRDVVDTYADIDPDRLHADGESILNPLDLDERARNDLVMFLQTLSEPGN